ncbi:hypothetical protein KJ567_06630 [Candidatus Bipolaricaulota bacterium]|nr:hypothetical protein [Candidatus Bipolaricaulota bacterium]
MRSIRAIAAALLLVGLCGCLAGGFEHVGALFELGSSARALGMGGAFTALVDDESAVMHNPAALGWLDGLGISSLYVSQFGGISYGSLGAALPCVGLNVLFLDSGFIPTQGGAIRYSSQGLVASTGIAMGPIGIGARWRLLRVSSPTRGRGWAFDPALLLVTDVVRAGMILEGALSSPMDYDAGPEEAWPLALRLGVALTLSPSLDVSWSAAFEASGLFTASSRLTLGLEAWIGEMGARVGFDGEALTYGLSVRFAGLQFDWAYAARTDLGASHRV